MSTYFPKANELKRQWFLVDATGIPVGSDIEYADEVTMARALEGRREV